MSVASILKTDLASLAVRLVTVDSADHPGVRVIEGIEPVKIPANVESIWEIVGKAILKVGGWLFDVGGWALSGICSLSVSVFVSTVNYVINFDWNATDEQLAKQVLQKAGLVTTQIGGAIGNFAGFVFFGGLGTLVAYRFNVLLAVKVLWDVGEEALEELCANVSSITKNIAIALIQAQMVAAYSAIRWVLKTVWSNPNSPLTAIGTKIFGSGFTEAVKNWGEKGSKPWTIAKFAENLIEALPDWLEDPIEEMIEEFWDAGQEALYIAAGDIDQYIGEQQIQKQVQNGPLEVVEVQPNREEPENKLVLAGPQELIKPAIVTALVTDQMIREKDLGLLVGGEPVASNITTPGLPWARIVFSASKTKKVKPTYIDIHNLDRTKWDNWEAIKLACGGPNGYMWGPYRVQAVLPDNTELLCFAATENEGIDLLEGFLRFTLAGEDPTKIVWEANHQMRKGSRVKYDSTYKRPRRQYPWEFTIVNPTRVLNEENGKANRSGIYKDRDAFIKLWPDIKPADFNEKITELFRTPGPND